ncbi:hypothetical protein K435DRAFT_806935 [Dendrothele bispora CBS 962.96]|uniref:Uncharacterized protein n=1 Tax=Dendrothele bispora (strain CBS 962.96) TaxID=1314807 RepID=A0A4S8L6B3_DENBC|nr:hypothetical protein K435DRAFT_806935 [Dendrothele bispora CBS 962.96]
MGKNDYADRELRHKTCRVAAPTSHGFDPRPSTRAYRVLTNNNAGLPCSDHHYDMLCPPIFIWTQKYQFVFSCYQKLGRMAEWNEGMRRNERSPERNERPDGRREREGGGTARGIWERD